MLKSVFIVRLTRFFCLVFRGTYVIMDEDSLLGVGYSLTICNDVRQGLCGYSLGFSREEA